MPNGGSDNCGTCRFNRKNKGEPGYGHAHSNDPDYCEIRQLEIDNPFWTYCVNQNNTGIAWNGKPVPLGPVRRGGTVIVDGVPTYQRRIWVQCPDTEEIRQGLLNILERCHTDGILGTEAHELAQYLPILLVRQLGEFREVRALPRLRWIIENSPGPLAELAREMAETIEETGTAGSRPWPQPRFQAAHPAQMIRNRDSGNPDTEPEGESPDPAHGEDEK